MGSPAVVVIGDVVSLREEVRWAERRPLAGRRVVVTRPRHQAGALASRLEAYGAEVVAVPTIVLEPPDDPDALDRAITGVASYDWIVFTSTNGVRTFFARFDAFGKDIRALGNARLAAIGSETARALGALLLRPALVAAEYRAEGLLDALAGEPMDGRRVLLPRAAGARAVLREELQRRGALVDDVATYRARRPTREESEPLLAALDARGVDAITFTSSSTVQHFADVVGADRLAAIATAGVPVIACIGPVTSDTARACGLGVAVQPATYTANALAAALARHFCKGVPDPVRP
jgi:uroporphyrinogen III methyltransferase/synthase